MTGFPKHPPSVPVIHPDAKLGYRLDPGQCDDFVQFQIAMARRFAEESGVQLEELTREIPR